MINLKNKKPRLPFVAARRVVGKKLKMSFSEDKTADLWQSFMPSVDKVKNRRGNELFSIQFYPRDFFENLNPRRQFEKMAAVHVFNFDSVPDGMETFELPGGLYALFEYKGKASEASDTFRYIFSEWLPESGYILDDRPHFEILGEKYKKEDPDSEEEIWIPVKSRP